MTEFSRARTVPRLLQCEHRPLRSMVGIDRPQARGMVLGASRRSPQHALKVSAQVSGPECGCSTASLGGQLPSPTAAMPARTVTARRNGERRLVTAEVAILNRNGVGIAADSAATLSGIRPKTYNTANKLFALSVMQPVAVMIYASSTFGAAPWETIIKTYRDHRKIKPLATISAYAEDLVAYLADQFRDDSVDYRQSFLPEVMDFELDRLRQGLLRAIEANPETYPVTALGFNGAIRKLIENRKDELKSLPDVENLEDSDVEHDISPIREELEQRISETLGSLTSLVGLMPDSISSEVHELIFELMCNSTTKAGGHPGSSGVVLAGFGDKELLSALSHFNLDGVVDGAVRRSKIENKCISDDNVVEIVPFAQKEIIRTLMEGVHPRYSQHALGLVYQFLEETKQKFGSESEDLISHCDRFYESVESSLVNYVQRTHSDPVRAIVEHLPKDGLGDMAEALVDITSLTQRITPGSETVGGPTDVAVITKGDGLIWIKRKHYFEQELNPRYFERLKPA